MFICHTDILFILIFHIVKVRLRVYTNESRCYVQIHLDDFSYEGKFCNSDIWLTRMFFKCYEKFLPFL